MVKATHEIQAEPFTGVRWRPVRAGSAIAAARDFAVAHPFEGELRVRRIGAPAARVATFRAALDAHGRLGVELAD